MDTMLGDMKPGEFREWQVWTAMNNEVAALRMQGLDAELAWNAVFTPKK